ncbi:MAG: ltrA 3 [Gammaproteobacteria bacterium]|jgi:RNA-directed DNA polymerase|nr:ltrA 3 [Gammaproteobacteria bacterium]
MKELQMTVMAKPSTGAPSTTASSWDAINWQKVEANVRRLQMRIAKAFREGKRGKAKALQWILTHSFYGKVLAVKRVVQNKGAKTPGIDNVIWKSSIQKMQAALSLKRRGYQTKPLKRIYIPKKQKGKFRPLSIPTMKCRAMQALHLLALEPIAETIADKHAYGFRPLRSTADAIGRCYTALAQKTTAQYILEADICACFDNISHAWLLENIPMDKEILRKWLTAGYIDKRNLLPTTIGTPQGSIIAPTLLTITLSGLGDALKAATKRCDKVYESIYADDFIITGVSKEVLNNVVKPVVENFLNERGLSLSQEKTKISRIQEGFDFLGMNIRKYNSKLIIKPAKSSVKRLLTNIREAIKTNRASSAEELIRQLNPKIRGWANYYQYACAKSTFSYVDHQVFLSLWRWATRRHPNKGIAWIKNKYFRKDKTREWVFSTNTMIYDREGNSLKLDLVAASHTKIKRHIKIKAEANPYDPVYREYFEKRRSSKWVMPNQPCSNNTLEINRKDWAALPAAL